MLVNFILSVCYNLMSAGYCLSKQVVSFRDVRITKVQLKRQGDRRVFLVHSHLSVYNVKMYECKFYEFGTVIRESTNYYIAVHSVAMQFQK